MIYLIAYRDSTGELHGGYYDESQAVRLLNNTLTSDWKIEEIRQLEVSSKIVKGASVGENETKRKRSNKKVSN